MKYIIAIAATIITLISCNNSKPQNENQENISMQDTPVHSAPSNMKFAKGDIVPTDEVCMVNNEYMAKKQLKVDFENKVYYGCCEMCKERIPKDASVRFATDPISQKQIDKSSAIIAITGNNGEVSYFENKSTYSDFLKTLKN
ncbi:hypothetical protein [Elizabethkingia meningoseptica]|uniref:hypothetical protein n=1 Tax=Elizabethkingia meningoseptica TaxID=238 RepID=UPI0023AF05CD|nr:hypothetical protein [Elizabethkingia meningoseptica]MDE5527211.1 hypothetical protein [Elizabethkingia meningoseptica]